MVLDLKKLITREDFIKINRHFVFMEHFAPLKKTVEDDEYKYSFWVSSYSKGSVRYGLKAYIVLKNKKTEKTRCVEVHNILSCGYDLFLKKISQQIGHILNEKTQNAFQEKLF